MSLNDLTAHLTPARWEQANRILAAKALGEYSHERLLAPAPAGADRHVVTSDDGSTEYRFTAVVRALEHWDVDPVSVSRHRAGEVLPVDALELVMDLRGSLGLDADLLPIYLEEITSTLASLAFRLSRPRPGAAALLDADFQDVEAAMIEGHPCFVANSGRLGWGVADHQAYAPEAAASVRLVWIAVHRDHATLSLAADLDVETLLTSELDEPARARFAARMDELGLDLGDYHLMPVHPWQWEHRVAITFAVDVARRRIVLLGEGDEAYRAQQSIRTFFNVSSPRRSYVKTALSVVNMGFVRGLSAEYMRATPAINDWVAGLVADDDVLRATGVEILREKAALGYHPEPYESATEKGSMYRQMLAALWRESPVPRLRPGQRVVTMASLLHVDPDGRSFVGALVGRSGLPAAAWLRRYLDAYLHPLLHCFHTYDLVFMPHGENVILVLENDVVQRVLLKDIAEEVAVMSESAPLPETVERIRADVPEHLRVLSLFTDVIDCYLRHLGALVDREGVLGEDDFWRTLAESIHAYQDANPHLADRFARDDVFAPRFTLSCLNRLQMRNTRQMVNLADPAGGLQLVGTLENPLARYRERAPLAPADELV